jgi:RNA polymerase sigma factor (sigma-70 family)
LRSTSGQIPLSASGIFTVMGEPVDSWFKREIIVHEAALLRYLARNSPRRNDIYDLRQDIYIRVYEAAAKSLPRAAKTFLFTTARNLIVDHLRRQRIVAIDVLGDLDASDLLVDEYSPERRTSAHQDLRELAEAFDKLPPKCRETVWLRRVDELSQKEVAEKLGVSQKTVEKHVMRGMRLLADAVARDLRRVRSKKTQAVKWDVDGKSSSR